MVAEIGVIGFDPPKQTKEKVYVPTGASFEQQEARRATLRKIFERENYSIVSINTSGSGGDLLSVPEGFVFNIVSAMMSARAASANDSSPNLVIQDAAGSSPVNLLQIRLAGNVVGQTDDTKTISVSYPVPVRVLSGNRITAIGSADYVSSTIITGYLESLNI